MGRRSNTLNAATKAFIEAHDRWANDFTRPEHPDETYWDAYDELMEVWDTGEIPSSCRDLFGMIERLTVANEELDEESQELSGKFCGAVEAIKKHFEVKERAPVKVLEPLKDIMALPGMTIVQAAKMYGFIDRHGNAMTHLVTQELNDPGSVTKTPGAVDGRDWANPLNPPVVEDDDEVNDDGTGEETAESKGSQPPMDGKSPKGRGRPRSKPVVCPETPKQLWEQKVGIPQAAKMLVKSESEVASMFAEFSREAKSVENKRLIKELQAEGV